MLYMYTKGNHTSVHVLFQGTCKILSQIGQDTAITEQQIRIVKAQMEKIQRLKKVRLNETAMGFMQRFGQKPWHFDSSLLTTI